MSKKIISQAKRLSKSFLSIGTEQRIINELNLDINEGDFTVIMGSSGSGKSTRLYIKDGACVGELSLESYGIGTDSTRDNQLKDFLTNMGW